LRRRLRVHGRQLGDRFNGGKEQSVDRLVEEIAYEHWHRMLFSRFLAENNLLMYPDPDDPVSVTLAECEDLAADERVKIGARELPAVTQLFTEPYMVSFLLDNSLGAWWVVRSEKRETKVRELLQTAESEAELRENFYG